MSDGQELINKMAQKAQQNRQEVFAFVADKRNFLKPWSNFFVVLHIVALWFLALITCGPQYMDFVSIYLFVMLFFTFQIAAKPLFQIAISTDNFALWHPANLALVWLPIALYGLRMFNFRGLITFAVLVLWAYVARRNKKSVIVHADCLNPKISLVAFAPDFLKKLTKKGAKKC